MTANDLCSELAYILQYLDIRFKKTNLTYTNAGLRQFTFYIFHTDNPTSFEEWMIADTPAGQPVVHTDNISFNASVMHRHNGRIEAFDIANHFYDNQEVKRI